MRLAFRVVPMSEAHARDTANWHYDGDMSIYDNPSWDEMTERRWGVTIPQYRERDFLALIDADENVAGFLRLIDRGEWIDVGLGLRPDLCGKGHGVEAMAHIEQEALRRKGPCTMRLSVRTNNRRAIRCYEKAGWTRVGVIERTTLLGPGEFLKMERRAEP